MTGNRVMIRLFAIRRPGPAAQYCGGRWGTDSGSVILRKTVFFAGKRTENPLFAGIPPIRQLFGVLNGSYVREILKTAGFGEIADRQSG
ncbi:hypothetical protein DQG13_23040 [Paenibacillus sp. YN15]|nr:hypothetical protein DQG13_23040 [Paenibacillus sp. YN15]